MENVSFIPNTTLFRIYNSVQNSCMCKNTMMECPTYTHNFLLPSVYYEAFKLI
jgi:hypothetical protein